MAHLSTKERAARSIVIRLSVESYSGVMCFRRPLELELTHHRHRDDDAPFGVWENCEIQTADARNQDQAEDIPLYAVPQHCVNGEYNGNALHQSGIGLRNGMIR